VGRSFPQLLTGSANASSSLQSQEPIGFLPAEAREGSWCKITGHEAAGARVGFTDHVHMGNPTARRSCLNLGRVFLVIRQRVLLFFLDRGCRLQHLRQLLVI